KQQGLWMGGNVPLGYDANGRRLVINPAEAETVRRLFTLYLELGCVRRVKEEADRLGLKTRSRILANGDKRGGTPLSPGHVSGLCLTPGYTGQIAHRGKLYPGQHPALIGAETWNAVHARLAGKRSRHRSASHAAEPSLLTGLLFDAAGERLT